jgi:hypothetical protein
LLLVATAYTTFREQWAIRGHDDLMTAVAQLQRIPGDVPVYLPDEVALAYATVLPAETYARISERARKALFEQGGIRDFLRAHGISELTGQVLINDFNEEEQANLARTTAAAVSARAAAAQRIDVYLSSEQVNPRVGWTSLTMADMLRRLGGSAPVAVLLPSDARVPDYLKAVTIWRGERWVWYASAPGAVPRVE